MKPKVLVSAAAMTVPRSEATFNHMSIETREPLTVKKSASRVESVSFTSQPSRCLSTGSEKRYAPRSIKLVTHCSHALETRAMRYKNDKNNAETKKSI